MNQNVMFSSKTDLWETPQEFFDNLNRQFHFTLDVCALPENAKCEQYYTPEQDGLAQSWSGIVWCNPPYGRQIGKWVEKAHKTAEGGAVNGGHATASPNRYGMVSRLHLWQGRNPICPGAAEIRRMQEQRTFSLHGGDIQEKE